MAFSKTFSKVIISSIFISLWAASACLIVVGSLVWHNTDSIDGITKSTYALLPTVILIGSGVFLFLLGVIGCFACLNENRCLLSTFFILLLLILIGEVTAAAMGIVYHGQLRSAIETELNTELNKYQNDSILRKELDFIQHSYQCCGVNNFTDWLPTSYYSQNGFPNSCCLGQVCGNSTVPMPDGLVFSVGCLSKLESDFSRYLGLIAAFALVVAILQALGLLASCVLLCRDRQRAGYQLFGEPDGGRHV